MVAPRATETGSQACVESGKERERTVEGKEGHTGIKGRLGEGNKRAKDMTLTHNANKWAKRG